MGRTQHCYTISAFAPSELMLGNIEIQEVEKLHSGNVS